MAGDVLLVYAAHRWLPGLCAPLQPIPIDGIMETIHVMKKIVHMPQLGIWSEDTSSPTIEQCIGVLEYVHAELS